jgi:molybdopterin-guanine dinucleotide biosynthesis protein A
MRLPSITGVILAGGLARRMGGQDKGLVSLFHKPLYLHVAEKISPQVDRLLINANRNITIYQKSGYPVISDTLDDFPGPLAGMLAGMEYSTTDWTLFVPCDMPFIPTDLVQRLWQSRNGRDIAYVHDGQREHPTLCLINKRRLPDLKQFLANGDKKLMLFLQACDAQPVIFSDNPHSFYNLNTLADCQQLENERESI